MEDKKRVKEGIKYGILYTTIIIIAGTLALQIFAVSIVNLFGLSDETAKLCILAIRIISIGFVFAGWNIAVQGVFQAIGCGISSLVISVLRLCVIVLPLAALLSTFTNGIYIMWFAFPIAEAVALVVAVVLMINANKVKITEMGRYTESA